MLISHAQDKILYTENVNESKKQMVKFNKWVQQSCRIKGQNTESNCIFIYKQWIIQKKIKRTITFTIYPKR